MKRFNEFINEGKVFYDSKFFSVIKELRDVNKIAEYLYDIQGKEYDKMKIGLVGFSDTVKTLKFKPFDKLKKDVEEYRGDYFNDENAPLSLDTKDDIDIKKASKKTNLTFMTFDDILEETKDEAKIGRLIRKILKGAGISDFKDTDIEEFVNILKTEFKTINDEFKYFELVDGYDINKYYLAETYSKGDKGDLGNSCMRYRGRNSYMDFYALNPESVKLLIYKDPQDTDKILGRALLWFGAEDIDSGKVNPFMDRVYYADDSDKILFETYANKKGWSHLGNTEPNHKIKIKDGRYENYPYLDTFSYYNFEEGYLTNDYDVFDYGEYIDLCDTEGNYECHECNGEYEHKCDECYGDGEIDCQYCRGYEEVECRSCDGSGEIECTECDGSGEIECTECEGSGEDEEGDSCEDCDGNGHIDCLDCDGDGEIDCEDCTGRGEVMCDECQGEGTEQCESCWGDGTTICSNRACKGHYNEPVVSSVN